MDWSGPGLTTTSYSRVPTETVLHLANTKEKEKVERGIWRQQERKKE